MLGVVVIFSRVSRGTCSAGCGSVADVLNSLHVFFESVGGKGDSRRSCVDDLGQEIPFAPQLRGGCGRSAGHAALVPR